MLENIRKNCCEDDLNAMLDIPRKLGLKHIKEEADKMKKLPDELPVGFEVEVIKEAQEWEIILGSESYIVSSHSWDFCPYGIKFMLGGEVIAAFSQWDAIIKVVPDGNGKE